MLKTERRPAHFAQSAGLPLSFQWPADVSLHVIPALHAARFLDLVQRGHACGPRPQPEFALALPSEVVPTAVRSDGSARKPRGKRIGRQPIPPLFEWRTREPRPGAARYPPSFLRHV